MSPIPRPPQPRLLVGLFSDATVEHVLARELLQVVLVEPFIRRSESHIKD